MKTIICDIDGTIFKYPPNGSAQIVQEGEQLLPGVQEQFNQWEMKGHKVILITGRRESLRSHTEAALIDHGIPFDMLIMGCPNDINYAGKIKAHAANLERDAGLSSFNWEDVGL